MAIKLNSIDPTSGPTSGGQKVTIHGDTLMNVTAVTFNGIAASSVTSDATHITCKTPAGHTGNADVVASDNDGNKSNVITFTYVN
ncbi:IPT/TIG domain-containing protein [Streptomyces sp. NPDC048717]|uniref:IPT/TIG domain-containing protein n=1 Tax=unclassified Streptomyces TaxID=2593676 RepID=UPI003416613E